jgi:hypothetical protein
VSSSDFLRRQGWRMRANYWEHPKFPDVLHSVGSALLQAGMWLEQQAPSPEERRILENVDAMFDRSPQWFEIHLPTLYGQLRSRQIAHVAKVMNSNRAVRGEGSQHDLPSRTAEADAAIGHAETLCCTEVAPLGGGIRGDTSEGET